MARVRIRACTYSVRAWSLHGACAKGSRSARSSARMQQGRRARVKRAERQLQRAHQRTHATMPANTRKAREKQLQRAQQRAHAAMTAGARAMRATQRQPRHAQHQRDACSDGRGARRAREGQPQRAQ
eukprot:1653222-Pleurochrysis_carterae.AAC.1